MKKLILMALVLAAVSAMAQFPADASLESKIRWCRLVGKWSAGVMTAQKAVKSKSEASEYGLDQLDRVERAALKGSSTYSQMLDGAYSDPETFANAYTQMCLPVLQEASKSKGKK
jgi:hypothetical protein